MALGWIIIAAILSFIFVVLLRVFVMLPAVLVGVAFIAMRMHRLDDWWDANVLEPLDRFCHRYVD